MNQKEKKTTGLDSQCLLYKGHEVPTLNALHLGVCVRGDVVDGPLQSTTTRIATNVRWVKKIGGFQPLPFHRRCATTTRHCLLLSISGF
jgi:hypothetical protein